MVAVAEAGFRAIAPDFRGYGLSEQPREPEKATWEDLVDDLLAILDSLSIPKVPSFPSITRSSFTAFYDSWTLEPKGVFGWG